MSRSTQYIGMNRYAQKFIQDFDELPMFHENGEPHHFVFGMFDEKVPLSRWRGNLGERKVYVQEVVQITPWSSGPMIFTCLQVCYHDGTKEPVGKWVEDSAVQNEFDYESGKYYV